MGWQWLEGDTDVPELTERETFREVLLKGRLTAALRKLNLRDGQPWLDDVRIARATRDLEQAAGHRLMEVNQAGRNCCSRARWLMVCPSGTTAARSRSSSSTSRTPPTMTSLSSTSSR